MRIQLQGRAVDVDDARYDVFQHSPVIAGLFGSIASGARDSMGRDAGESIAFLVSQLAYTETQVFQRQYTPLQYEQLLPIDMSAGEYADSIRIEIEDFAGQAKRISGKDEVPTVSVAREEATWPVYLGGVGYEFTQEELRQSAFLRRALPETLAVAALESYRRHMNKVGLYGENAVTGLFNSAQVTVSTPATGNWATSATADEILADVNAAIATEWAATQYNTLPTHLVVPPAAFSRFVTLPRATGSDMTVLEFLQKANLANAQGGSLQILPGFGLDTAGAGGAPRAVLYARDPQNVVMHLPLPLRFLAPQYHDLSVKVPGEYKYSGAWFRRPKTALYIDGV
jgi:hypothetical protein